MDLGGMASMMGGLGEGFAVCERHGMRRISRAVDEPNAQSEMNCQNVSGGGHRPERGPHLSTPTTPSGIRCVLVV